MRSHLVMALLTLVGARGAAAQDRRAEIVGGWPGRYPEVLRAAGIGGTVRLRVTVLPGDTLAADETRILSSPHPGFDSAAREMVARWRYRAATMGGQAVADTLEVAVEYRLSGQLAELFDTTATEGPTRDSAGTWHAALIPLAITRGSHAVAPAIRDSVAIAVARKMAGTIGPTHGGGAPIVCVSLRTGPGTKPLTPAEWEAVQLPGVAIVHPARCPPSFGSMAYIVGRVVPPGPGPTLLEIDEVGGWEGGWIVTHLHLGQSLWDCAVRASAPTTVVRCRETGAEVY